MSEGEGEGEGTMPQVEAAEQAEVTQTSGIRFPEGTSAQDVAVVVALLAAAGGEGEAPVAAPAEWGAPYRAVRRPTVARQGGWRGSTLP